MIREIAYTAYKQITVPDVRLTFVPKTYTVTELRGYAYTVAVLDASGECVGWAIKEDVEVGK